MSLASVISRVPWRSPGFTAGPIRSVSLVGELCGVWGQGVWATGRSQGVLKLGSQEPAASTTHSVQLDLWALDFKEKHFLYVCES